MRFELNGKLHQISPTQVISEKFSKREMVVECENGNYTEFIRCEVINDNIKPLNNAQTGWHISAKCSLKGRYYNKKDGTQGLINSIQAYSVEVRQNGLTEPAEMYTKNISSDYAPF